MCFRDVLRCCHVKKFCRYLSHEIQMFLEEMGGETPGWDPFVGHDVSKIFNILDLKGSCGYRMVESSWNHSQN